MGGRRRCAARWRAWCGVRFGITCCCVWLADKMGKVNTMYAVTAAGVMASYSIAAMQKYLNVHYDKNGEKFASPGFSVSKCEPPPAAPARRASAPAAAAPAARLTRDAGKRAFAHGGCGSRADVGVPAPCEQLLQRALPGVKGQDHLSTRLLGRKKKRGCV